MQVFFRHIESQTNAGMCIKRKEEHSIQLVKEKFFLRHIKLLLTKLLHNKCQPQLQYHVAIIILPRDVSTIMK